MAIGKRLRFRVFQRDNFTCQYCGERAPDVVLQVDHKHPKSLGGTDEEANLTTACFGCNNGKSNVVLTTDWLVTLVHGPLSMQQRRTTHDVTWWWVMQNDEGEYRDIIDWHGVESRPVGGHPRFNHDVKGWRLVGAYLCYIDVDVPPDPTTYPAKWLDLDGIIFELTA